MKGQKVLVIHNSETARKSIHQTLAHFNLHFIFASDGLDGLAAAKYECPDLIITNINLAVLDGLAISRMLRKDCCTEDKPIILLHDQLDYNILHEAKKLNVKALLTKPYLDNTLIYAVKRALQAPLEKTHDRVPRYEEVVTSRQPVHRFAN